jgi:exopolysaccharide biosynthesis protein
VGKYERKRKKKFSVWRILLTILLSIPAMVLTVKILSWSLTNVGVPGNANAAGSVELAVMDRYDMKMTNAISSALDGVLSIEKVYWLNDDDQIAPEPNQEKYTYTTDPSSLQGFLDEAKELLGVEDTLFSTETKLYAGSQVITYLDETIMVITWKELIDGTVYTLSEVKIAHPSQFRRFLADGVYGSEKQYVTTEMATTVNAVTASSGDFYKFRPTGIKVYNGQVMHFNNSIDTMFITEEGDFLFVYRRELADKAAAQKFVDENKVRFSLAFGPVLVDESQCIPIPAGYGLGEPEDKYPRAAIAKMPGELHYLMVAANQDPDRGYNNVPNMAQFGRQLQAFGAVQAYALDGGQTAVIVTNDQLINRPSYGYQRMISDIIYFATAIPDGG